MKTAISASVFAPPGLETVIPLEGKAVNAILYHFQGTDGLHLIPEHLPSAIGKNAESNGQHGQNDIKYLFQRLI